MKLSLQLPRRLRTALADTLTRSILRNSGWATAGQAVGAIAAIVETIVLARAFPIAVFGTLTVIVSASELVYGLLDFRTGQAVIRYVPPFEQDTSPARVRAFLRLALSIDTVIAFAGMAAIILFGGLISALTEVPAAYGNLLVIVGVGGAFKTVVRSAGSYLRVAGAFPRSVALGIVSSVMRLLIVAVSIGYAPTLLTAAIAIAIADTLFALLMGVAAALLARTRQHDPWRGKLRELAADRRDINGFLLSTNVESTIRVFSNKLDVLLIAALSSTATVGVYKVATRIAGVLLLFSDPLLMAIYPEMSQLNARGELGHLRPTLRRMSLAMGGMALAMLVGFAVAGEWGLEIIAGAEYARAHTAALIMLTGTSLAMVLFWARPVLLVQGRTRHLVGIIAIAMSVEFLLIALLTPKFGAVGAAVGYGAFYATSAMVCLLLLVSGSRGRLLRDATAK